MYVYISVNLCVFAVNVCMGAFLCLFAHLSVCVLCVMCVDVCLIECVRHDVILRTAFFYSVYF
jgi:hypothetical protein